jgi:type IV pilus assembly protein PilC
MPTYAWEGKTREGIVKRGVIEALNQASVEAVLRAQGITITSIKEKKERAGFSIGEIIKRITQKVKPKELMVFTRQFAVMIGAGLPINQCLELLGTQQKNQTFKKIILDVKATVEGGSTLADALRKYPNVFDDLYVNLIAAAEMGGVMEQVLLRLATYIEKAEKLKGQVKSAMTYPIIVLVVAVGVVAVILTFVIPTFEKMFAGFGGNLPTPTRIVINMSKFLRANLHFIIIAVVGIYYSIRRIYKTKQGKRAIDSFLLKIPMFQSLIIKVAVARFSRTLSTMLSSGVPILEAIDISARGIGNTIVKEAIMKVKEGVSEGKPIVEPLKAAKIFPNMVVQMISVGEQTGALDQMLGKIADFYDEEVDAAVAALASMIEPLMVVFLGGVVGALLVSMYLPIFKLATLIK